MASILTEQVFNSTVVFANVTKITLLIILFEIIMIQLLLLNNLRMYLISLTIKSEFIELVPLCNLKKNT